MADLQIIDKIFVDVPQTVRCVHTDTRVGLELLSYAHFKNVWKARYFSYVLLVRGEDEDEQEFMQDLYRVITDRLLTHTEETDSLTTAAATTASSITPVIDPQTRLMILRPIRIWSIYALYTLHECQVTQRKHQIILPQVLWPILEECASDFVDLPLRDPICVLRTMLDRCMFEFHIDYPRPTPTASEQPMTQSRWERMHELQSDRPTKQRRLVIPTEYAGQLHEISDIKAHLQLSKLREMSQDYTQAMNDLHVTTASTASSDQHTRAGTSTTAIAAAASSTQLSRVPSSASTPSRIASSSLPSASVKLLQRVERTIDEEQEAIRTLREPVVRPPTTTSLFDPSILLASTSSTISPTASFNSSFSTIAAAAAAASASGSTNSYSLSDLQALFMNARLQMLHQQQLQQMQQFDQANHVQPQPQSHSQLQSTRSLNEQKSNDASVLPPLHSSATPFKSHPILVPDGHLNESVGHAQQQSHVPSPPISSADILASVLTQDLDQ